MTYEEFLHAVRAAASVADTDEFLVFGSQAILVHDPDPPLELRQSIEMDVFPTKFPERSNQIDGALGELSRFTALTASTCMASASRRQSFLLAGRSGAFACKWVTPLST